MCTFGHMIELGWGTSSSYEKCMMMMMMMHWRDGPQGMYVCMYDDDDDDDAASIAYMAMMPPAKS